MARRKRRRKIRESQKKGRARAQKQYESLKDVQTVTGQAICDVSQFEEIIMEDEEEMIMKSEEVIIDESEIAQCTHNDEERKLSSTSSWLRWLIPLF